MLFRLCGLLLVSGLLAGCQTATLAKNVKLVAFEDDVQVGKGSGPVRGEDCVWYLVNNPLGKPPTLDKALQLARSSNNSKGELRYLNNVKTEWDGFNFANIVAQNCLVVKGVGYR
jgi:hypothetical protein